MALVVNTRSRWPKWLATVAVVVLVAGAGWWWSARQTSNVERQTAQHTVPAPKLVRAEMKLAFVGDIFVGRGVDREARKTDTHAQYPFAKLDGLELDQYQAVIGNLECPSVNDEVDYQQQFAALLFNCPTSYLPQLAKHIDIVSLANNHTANQDGQTGLETTRTNLDEQNIAHFGNFEPGIIDEICKLIPIDIELVYDDGSRKDSVIAAQFCGYHTVFRRAAAAEIAAIIPGSSLPTFVMPHAGAEYRAEPIPGKVEEFRAMIDAGADAVVGAHPHWVQSTEIYQDKLIAYSLGNFIFDQPPGETSLGALLSAGLVITDLDYLEQLEQIAVDCPQLTGCELLEELKKPQLTIDYEAQAVDIVDYRPQLGSDSSQQKLRQRLDLPQTSTDD